MTTPQNAFRTQPLTCDEPLDRIDVHGAQRPKTLSSLFFYVDIQPHHDVKVQCQQFLHSKTSTLDNHILSQVAMNEQEWGSSSMPTNRSKHPPSSLPCWTIDGTTMMADVLFINTIHLGWLWHRMLGSSSIIWSLIKANKALQSKG